MVESNLFGALYIYTEGVRAYLLIEDLFESRDAL